MDRIIQRVYNTFQKYDKELKKKKKGKNYYLPVEKKPNQQTNNKHTDLRSYNKQLSSFYPVRIVFLTLSSLAESCIRKIRNYFFLS